MAKKTKTYSQVQATDALEQLGKRGTSATELIYDLLRIFAGYGDGQVRRTKDGPGNLAKDGETVLIKNLVAYRPVAVNTLDGNCSAMYDIINDMRDDAKIAKHSPRLYIVSNGVMVVAYDPKENDWYENSIELLWKDFEFFTPLAGIEKIQFTQDAEADVKSAELMAKLFDDIRRYNDIRDPQTVHALNVFMSRLLFCFFAEAIRGLSIRQRRPFQRPLSHSGAFAPRPDLDSQLRRIQLARNQPRHLRLDDSGGRNAGTSRRSRYALHIGAEHRKGYTSTFPRRSRRRI